MKDKSRLGQGLDAIFGQKFNDDITNKDIAREEINLNLIKTAKWQPRNKFDETALDELAHSIQRYGVLQPILLKKINNGYELVAGERRYRACKQLNKPTIPAIIINFSDQMLLEISMIENLQRQDLNPIEKAQGFIFLIEKLKVSQEELAKRLGINRSLLSNYIRINSLPEEIKTKIANKEISFGHAKILVNKTNAVQLAKEIVEKKLTVRQAEKRVYQKKETTNTNKNELKRLEEMIAAELALPTKIEMQKNDGKVIIEFQDLDQLEKIISKICA